MPWAGCGFRTNLDTSITALYEDLAFVCVGFFQGFAVWDRVVAGSPAASFIQAIAGRAVRRYEAEYKLLAVDVREFAMWAMPGEHEATRATVDRAGESLGRLEQLMVSLAGRAQRQADQMRRTAAVYNRAVLGDSLVTAGMLDAGHVAPHRLRGKEVSGPPGQPVRTPSARLSFTGGTLRGSGYRKVPWSRKSAFFPGPPWSLTVSW